MTISAFSFSFSDISFLAIIAPITGMKISAETSEATMTMITTIGR